ncbi:MAG: hypothetical protein ABIT01_09195 [Thermoanaerobaculia bacterium]
MKNPETHGRHLTADEVILRVFPVNEEPAPIPMHLAVCAECQARVSGVRDGLLLDRGAVAGSVDDLPEPFWMAQRAAIMHAIREEPSAGTVHPFSIPQSFVRRPFLAFASLAAALTLVAGMSLVNPFRTAPAAPRASATASASASASARPHATASADSTDRADEELLLSVDSILAEDTPYSNLIPLGVS